MNGPIAQAVALTCHGNARLAGVASPPFFPGNSTCQFCAEVEFVKRASAPFSSAKEVRVAPTPDEWFDGLGRDATRGLRLRWTPGKNPRFPDRMSAGMVGGGGTWFIEASRGSRDCAWHPRWEVGDREAANRRIWGVSYLAGATLPRVHAGEIDACHTELREAIGMSEAFAVARDLAPFARGFRAALESLTLAAPPTRAYHQDLAPAGFLSEEARRVLDSAQFAWVFGGMGSWNDLAFHGEDQRRYEELSERLFRAVVSSICAAASSTFPGADGRR